MNQQQFDNDLLHPNEWEGGVGLVNNPLRKLFDNPRQKSACSQEDEDRRSRPKGSSPRPGKSL